MLTWMIENSMQQTLNHGIIAYRKLSFHYTWISNSLLYEFLNRSFYWWLRALFFVSLPLQDCSDWPESVSPGSDLLSAGNWTKCYNWPASFRMQKLVGCGITTRKCWLQTPPPPPNHIYTQALKWQFYHLFTLLGGMISSSLIQSTWVR